MHGLLDLDSPTLGATTDLRPPVLFEHNVGQAPAEYSAVARADAYTAWFANSTVLFGARDSSAGCDRPSRTELVRVGLQPIETGPPRLRKRTNVHANFFIGDASRWVRGAACFEELHYRMMAGGISIIFTTVDRRLAFRYVAAPGVPTSAFRMIIDGADIDRGDDGDLVLTCASGSFVISAPLGLQVIDGESVYVPVQFSLEPGAFGFTTDHDPALPLEIDPNITFSTFVGADSVDPPGSSSTAKAVALDDNGYVYIAGQTDQLNFPTGTSDLAHAPFMESLHASYLVAFVMKLSSNGNIQPSAAGQPCFVTYLGGATSIYPPNRVGGDVGLGVATAPDGSVWVAGQTKSSDFPPMNSLWRMFGGPCGFIAKLSANGAELHFSSYVGGPDSAITAIAADDNDVYAIGYSDVNQIAQSIPLNSSLDNQGPAFLLGLRPDPSAQPTTGQAFTPGYGTRVGWGDVTARLNGVAVHGGHVYLAGQASANSFLTRNAAQPSIAGGTDAVVLHLNPDPSLPSTGQLIFSTFLGGAKFDAAAGIAVDASGRVYVAGSTQSDSIATTGVALSTRHPQTAGFVAKLNADGTKAYLTYIDDPTHPTVDHACVAIAASADGAAYVAGSTPTQAFLVGLTPNAATVTLSQAFGPAAAAAGLAFDDRCTIALVGATDASFPTKGAPINRGPVTGQGSAFGFALSMHLKDDVTLDVTPPATSPHSGQPFDLTATIRGTTGPPTGNVNVIDVTSGGLPQPLASLSVSQTSVGSRDASVTVAVTLVGTYRHRLRIEYGGDATHCQATTTLDIDVQCELVDATFQSIPGGITAAKALLVGGEIIVRVVGRNGTVPNAGTVELLDNPPSSGSPWTAAVSGGLAKFRPTFHRFGSHSLTAKYSGMLPSLCPGDDAATTILVQPQRVTLTFRALPRAIEGVATNVTIDVTGNDGGIPGDGTVSLSDSPPSPGNPWPAPVIAGTAQLQPAFSPWGRHDLSAMFSGTLDYAPEQASSQIDVDPATTPRTFAAGGGFSVARDRTSGRVYHWGDEASFLNQLGSGPAVPTALPWQTTGQIAEVRSGKGYGLLIVTDGSGSHLYHWGEFLAYGQQQFGPTPTLLLNNVTAAAGALTHALAIQNGNVVAWGFNDYSNLGLPLSATPQGVYVPPTIVPNVPPGTPIDVAASFYTSLILLNGSVYEFGWYAAGIPTKVSISTTDPIVAISAGFAYSLALDSGGRVWAWGAGQGPVQPDPSGGPVTIPLPSRASAISAGGFHALALANNGDVFAWGTNTAGQFGDGTPPEDTGTSTFRVAQMNLQASRAVAVEAGWEHSLIARADGTLLACGSNVNGQLGDGTNQDRLTPVPVKILTI